MAQTDGFRPTLYLLHQCPFCLKLVIYLSEADMLEQFALEIFEHGDDKGDRLREQLSPYFDKVSFPAAVVAPGKYIKGSDELIAHYAENGGPAPDTLRLLSYYSTGVMEHTINLFLENKKLQEKLEDA